MSLFRFFHRKRSDAELQNEIEAFLSEETADNVARRMSPDEARRQARIKLGNPQKVREICFSHVEPHARILDHRDCGDGFVHWRGHISFHNCALGFAEATSLSRSRAAGGCVRTLPRSLRRSTGRGIQLPPCCASRLLRLAFEDPRL